ncbi:MAG: transcriptional repressor [Chloroflexi bacterium]|nr:transcriptional repressor [Chloroflexota bacterium]
MITQEQRVRIRRQLAEVGLRATPQRLLILAILEETDEHLDAEAIYERARQWDAQISLATVYRALAKLKEAGLVAQRYFARDHRREYYEAVSKGEHYHFTCLGCGKVIEVRTPRIAQARQELSEALGLEFTHACICFEGYCPECAAKRRRGTLESRAVPRFTVGNGVTIDD